MLPARPIFLFGVKAVLLYALLAVPWPGVREAYAAVFHRACSVFFGTFGEQGIVRFRPMTAGFEMQDTEIEMINRRGGGQKLGFNAGYAGYLPTALLISLIVSTPVPWKRRGWALFFGLLLIHLFILLRVALLLVYEFRTGSPVGFYDFGGFMRLVLMLAVEGISISPVTSCIVPVIIRILVAFRRQDLATFIKPAP